MDDFAFMFYPGEYLRDTQCLSEKTQVAYDRIMCEHMRNICITQAQHNFFTKRLNEDEKSELSHVVSKTKGGYQIDWVVESIAKRQAYRESRRKNKLGKGLKKDKNISKTYDSHMVDIYKDINKDKDLDKTWFSEKNNFLQEETWQYKFVTEKSITLIELKKLMNEFLIEIELKEDFKSAKELRSHFTNTFNKNKKYGTKQTIRSRDLGAVQLLESGKKLFSTYTSGKQNT